MDIVLDDVEIINMAPHKAMTPSQRKNFYNTLQYIAGELIEQYKTPEDVLFKLTLIGKTNYTHDYNQLSVTCNLTPIRNKQKYPMLTIEATYVNDAAMTLYLLEDLLATLARYGLAALYNRSKEKIIVEVEKRYKRDDDAVDASSYITTTSLGSGITLSANSLSATNIATTSTVDELKDEIKELKEQLAKLMDK